ncbi:beta-galactosidase [Candidatus Xianfuyuplasma coldseepsis]|uniref:Beta-galactosidase n=1 Tax=Candidatus Xianfuyuplasma coldseepsis TaxID=2782163 RepID=A0A7L7KQJ1_9MOLU|nr:beta-galactosidase [Xianfuyuplasma coldseepsis]QMS85071.1 beta-galactosidase [Xianfuyuplasma coldseepsis]
MITYDNKRFIINQDKPFLWGGELHYFRVHKNDWKDRIKKIKDAGFNLVSTYIPWMWHEVEEGQMDLDGSTCPEKDLISFIQYVQDAGLYLLVRPGPYVMAETVNSGLPAWLLNNYPEIRAQKENGEYHNNNSVVSYLHPTYLEKVQKWYNHVFDVLVPFEIQNGGPIIMTQYDNEVGMFHWVTQQGDYSDVTLSYFIRHLETYNPSLLKKSTCETWDQLLSAYKQEQTTKEESIQLNQCYKTFFRGYIKDYLNLLISFSRERGSVVPPVVNIHGFSQIDYAKRGFRYPVGLSQLYETRTIPEVILAGDYYVGNIVSENFFDVIIANSFTAAIQPQNQPLFSAEFQGGFQNGVPRLQPTTHDLKSRLAISNGMNAINYYMFVGGENFDEMGMISRRHDWQAAIGMNGELRRHYFVIQRLVDVVKTYGEALLDASYQTSTTFGFYPDYFMTEYNNSYTRHQSNTMTRERQTYLFNGVGKSLAMNNISFDSIDLLDPTPIDVSSHPTLIVFSTLWMDKPVQKKLVTYMKEGGHLFLYPKLPERDLRERPCTILADAIGVTKLNSAYQRVHILEEDSVNCHVAEVYDVQEGYATLDQDHSQVTGFVQSVGKGQINLFGMAIKSDWDYIDDITKDVLELSNINAPFETDEWINIVIRESAQGRFYFIHNFEEFEKTTTIRQNGVGIFDNHVFTIPFRKGLILPENWTIAKDFTITYSTCEIHHKELSDDSITVTLTALNDHEKIAFEGDYTPSSSSTITINNNIIHLTKGVHTITWTKN